MRRAADWAPASVGGGGGGGAGAEDRRAFGWCAFALVVRFWVEFSCYIASLDGARSRRRRERRYQSNRLSCAAASVKSF